MRKTVLALLTVLALGACAVGPDYRRPSVRTPESWRFEDAQAKDVVNTPWWRQFGDPVLDGLVETALKENKDVRIAAARVEEYAGRYAYARSGQFPQAGGEAEALRTKETTYTNPPWRPARATPTIRSRHCSRQVGKSTSGGSWRRPTEAARADLLDEEGRLGVILTGGDGRGRRLYRPARSGQAARRGAAGRRKAASRRSGYSSFALTGALSPSWSLARRNRSTGRPRRPCLCSRS